MPDGGISRDDHLTDGFRNTFAKHFDRFREFRRCGNWAEKLFVAQMPVPVVPTTTDNDFLAHSRRASRKRFLQSALPCLLFRPKSAVRSGNLGSCTSFLKGHIRNPESHG